MLTYFLLLNLPATAGDLGMNEIPPPPLSRKPSMTKMDRLVQINNDELPWELIPWFYVKDNQVRPGNRYYDEGGNVYRWSEVEQILYKTPNCRDEYAAWYPANVRFQTVRTITLIPVVNLFSYPFYSKRYFETSVLLRDLITCYNDVRH